MPRSPKTPSNDSAIAEELSHMGNSKKKGPRTQVIVKYDAGFPNNLYIRGQGANLNWERGILLKNLKQDEWVWETNELFSSCQFKVLLNDTEYEDGENHEVRCGSSIRYTPHF